MKCFASRLFSIVLNLLAALAACIGCSKQDEAPLPRTIRWQGPETGYDGTTVIKPAEQGKNAEKEGHP